MGKNIKKENTNKIFLISTVKEELAERKKSRDASSSRGESMHMTDHTEETTRDKKKINKQRLLTVKDVKK